ncbi:MAG: hypothetical protein ABI858_02195 [Pseudoxanthomonas sp.]
MLEALRLRRRNTAEYLETRLEAERHDAAEARRRAAEADLAAADGGDGKAADRQNAAAALAAERVNRTALALQSAKDRAALEARQQAYDEHVAQYANCVALLRKRADAADKVQAAAQTLADASHGYADANVAVLEAMPASFPWAMRDGMCLDVDLATAVKVELARVQAFANAEPYYIHLPFAQAHHQCIPIFEERAARVLGTKQ